MSYTIDFSPTSGKTSFTIFSGEVNGPDEYNYLAIQSTDSVNDTLSLYGDYSYRFVPGFTFNIINSYNTYNDGAYTVSAAQYLPITDIFSIDPITATVTIPGNWLLTFTPNRALMIQSSTNNDGKWITRSSSFSFGNTHIVLKSVPLYGDSVPAGYKDGSLLNNSIIDGGVRTQVTIVSVTGAIPASLNVDGEVKYLIPFSEAATSLNLPGPGRNRYGEIIIENLVKILENACGSSPPIPPTKGQLWFNAPTLKVWDGTAWRIVGKSPTIQKTQTIGGGTFYFTPTYALGINQLWVFKNGLKLRQGADYTETSNTSVTLAIAATGADNLEFMVIT